MAASPKQHETQMMLLAAGMIVFFAVLFVAVFWLSNPNSVMRVYANIRSFETGGLKVGPLSLNGLWSYLPWGRDVQHSAASGRHSLLLIVLSSLPFALLSAIGIVTTGFLAYNRVSTEHLDRFITHSEPPSTDDILGKFAIIRPSAQFVRDYQKYELSSFRGAGRLPANPLTFLFDNGYIERIGPPAEWVSDREEFPAPMPDGFAHLAVNRGAIRAYYVSEFGPLNPFRKMEALTSVEAISAAIDQIPWYMALVLAPALARIHQSIFFVEPAYVASVIELHRFPDKVWSDLNALRRKEGDRLRLGFDDDTHRASEEALFQERAAKGGRKGKSAEEIHLVTLGEYLAENVSGKDGSTTIRAETLASVKAARQLLRETLTTHLVDQIARYPVGEDPRTRSYRFSSSPPRGAAEKAYFARVSKQMTDAADELHRIITSSAYSFGLMGAAVVRTRQMGIFHPTPWRWMRFVNLTHWRFLLDLGKPVPTVDSLGLHEHFQTERALELAIERPMLRRTPTDLARQAARFVDPAFRLLFAKSRSLDAIDTDVIFEPTTIASRPVQPGVNPETLHNLSAQALAIRGNRERKTL